MASTMFVVLPSQSKHGVIFGKNSDRPDGDVQEIVYNPAADSSGPIKCTYIDVEQSGPTKSVILNKSNWTWGAESGANECGVAIGNILLTSKDSEGDADVSVKRLLGVDLVRLGLERAANANEALDIITSLLVKYGQGGSTSNKSDSFYSNAFLIADATTAWILECVGKHWAAEEVKGGSRGISNVFMIQSKIDKHSEGVHDYAKSKGLWSGEGEFNFAAAFNVEDKVLKEKYQNNCKILTNAATAADFKEIDMFQLLRHEELSPSDTYVTMSSQVSVLSSSQPSVHWCTATKDPKKSVFKPFIFTPNAVISKFAICTDKDEPHILYSLHQTAISKKDVQSQSLLRTMEQNCVEELNSVVEAIGTDLSEFDELMKDCVETEVKFYR